jgi:Peptidase M1 N-terminal domain
MSCGRLLRSRSIPQNSNSRRRTRTSGISTNDRLINTFPITHRSIYSDVLKGGQVQASESVEIDTLSERVTYFFPSVLPAGSKAELTIAFGGRLTGSMAGYYKSSWELEGKMKYYALTQFEASLSDNQQPDCRLITGFFIAYFRTTRLSLLG